MAGRRVQRLNEQFKREISHLLRAEVQDPRVVGVTVTGVEVSADLTLARVWIRVPAEADRRKATLEGLEAAAPFIRRQLGALLRIRRIPELDFQEDRTLERALRIEALLREVRRPEEGGAGGSDPDAGGEDPDE